MGLKTSHIVFATPFNLGATNFVVANDAASDTKAWAKAAQDAGSNVYVCDGVADDVQIQAAIDALPMLDGYRTGIVSLSTGTFVVSSTILVYDTVSLIGAGSLATKLLQSADVVLIGIKSGNIWSCAEISNLWLVGSRLYSNTSHGISTYSTKEGTSVNQAKLTHLRIWNFRGAGIYLNNAQDNFLSDIFIEDSGDYASSTGALHLVGVTGSNHFNTITIHLVTDTGDNTFGAIYLNGNYVLQNIFVDTKIEAYSSTNEIFAIAINNAKRNVFLGGQAYVFNYDGSAVFSLVGGGANDNSISNWIMRGPDGVNTNTVNAIAVTGDNNTFRDCTLINFKRSVNINGSGNKLFSVHIKYEGTIPLGPDVETNAGNTGIIIKDCSFFPSLILVDAATSTIIRNNIEYVTENSGTGTINSGATSATITHGCSYTPTAKDITVTLTENPSNTPGAIWVDTITATQFNVNCENDPGASNLDFSWAVRRV